MVKGFNSIFFFSGGIINISFKQVEYIYLWYNCLSVVSGNGWFFSFCRVDADKTWIDEFLKKCIC